jgi:flagellin-like protein
MKLRKGISPLIATILLIVVAVALIAIVVAWGKSFTSENLAETSDVVNTECTGAAIQISDCLINSSDKMIFQVQNIGNVTFSASDDFRVSLTNVEDGNTTLDILTSTTDTVWSGLAPGQTVQFVLTDANFPGDVTDRYNVKVISNYCTSDAIAQKNNCYKW